MGTTLSNGITMLGISQAIVRVNLFFRISVSFVFSRSSNRYYGAWPDNVLSPEAAPSTSIFTSKRQSL